MKARPTLYRLATALAVCTLALLIVGAMTGSAGAATAARATWLRVHRHLGEAVGFLALVTVLWLLLSDAHKWLKAIGVTALVLIGVQALLGIQNNRTPEVAVVHAIVSHVCFALLTVLALGASPGWDTEGSTLEDRGWPSLRSLAWVTPPAVLLQIAFGAAYRHDMISSIPHIAGAFVVVLLILMTSTFVISAIPASPVEQRHHQGLRRGAIALMALVLAQLILGVSAFLARINLSGSPVPRELMAALRATHLGTGALVLGFAVALSAGILRRAAPAASAAGVPRLAGQGQRG